MKKYDNKQKIYHLGKPTKSGWRSDYFTFGMGKKWFARRKKRLKMQSDSRKINRAA